MIRFLAGLGLRRVSLVLGLMLAVAATEGVGILLLIPLLAAVGVDVSQGGTSRLAHVVEVALGWVGLPMTIGSVLAGYVLLVSLRALLARWQSIQSAALHADVVYWLRVGAFEAITQARWPFLATQRGADLVHALTTEATRAGNAVAAALAFLSNAVISAVYLGLALQTSWRATILALGAGAGLALALRRQTRRARTAGHEISESGRQMHAAVTDHLASLKLAKAYAAEERHAEHFRAVSHGSSEAWKASASSYALLRAGQEIGAVGILAAILFVALELMRVPAASVLLLVFLVARLVPKVSALQLLQHDLAASLPAFTVLEEVRRQCQAEAEPTPESSGTLDLQDHIRLEEVTYTYPGRAAPAVERVSLHIPARRITAVVGPSGSGKSTLADLLMGLLTPQAGNIYVDGVSLTPTLRRIWRQRVGYVPQESFLFHDSILANLTWAAPDAGPVDVDRALGLAAASAFVSKLPERVHTVVGDRGAKLSGGERQRLALARALLRRPAVLILDEATSALDAESEARIADVVTSLRGEVTTVLITHRLALAARADRIYVQEHGRVVEEGSWAELVDRPDGRLRGLCQAQGVAVPGGGA